MKKYEKEYILKKEQEAQLEDPVERLQVNCTGLNSFSYVEQVWAVKMCLCVSPFLDAFSCSLWDMDS